MLQVAGSLTSATLLKTSLEVEPKPKKKKKKVKEAKTITVKVSGKQEKPKKKKKKLREEVAEEPRKKKKKKKKGRELAVITDDLPAQEDTDVIDPEENKRKIKELKGRLKGLKSTFKKGLPHIHKLILDGEQERAAPLIQKHLMLALTEIIPVIENGVRQSGGRQGVYAFNSLVSQSRELIADVQSENDSSALAQRISNEVLNQAFVYIGQNLATTLLHIRTGLKPYLRGDASDERVTQLFNDNIKDIAKYIGEQHKDCVDKIYRMTVLEE